MAKLQQAETGLTTVDQRREALRRRIDEYRTAVQLLSQARELLDEKLVPLGDATAPQRAALEQWSSRITGELAARRAEALAETTAWQAQLSYLKQAVSAYEQSLRETFAARQQALRALLAEQLRLGPAQLPTPLAFNPADPEESYRLLAESIRASLEHVRDRFGQQLQSIAEQARAQSRPDTLATLPADERESAAQDMQAVQEQAQGLTEQSEPLLAALIDGVATAEPEALAAQAAQVAALVAPAGGLLTRVHLLTRRLQAVALTQEEASAQEALLALAPEDAVDFGEFERVLHERLPGADAWALLRALMQKSRVRLHVRLVQG
jgi:hypothetical protein